MSGRNTVAGLDIGHASIRACVGRVMEDGRIQILGTGVSPADGVRRGVIVDEKLLTAAIADAVERARHVSMIAFKDVAVGVGGMFINDAGEGVAPIEPSTVKKAVERLGLHVHTVMPSASAAARVATSSQAAGENTVVVDIGASSADVVVVLGGKPVLTAVVPVGGQHITNDIAYGLNVPIDEAERLKVRYGAAVEELAVADSHGGRSGRMESPRLFDIVEPRVSELLELVAGRLTEVFQKGLVPGDIVLTGGSALLGGMQQAAQRAFGVPVRIGVAEPAIGPVEVVTGPMYAGVIGLIMEAEAMTSDVPVAEADGARRPGLLASVRDWLSDFL